MRPWSICLLALLAETAAGCTAEIACADDGNCPIELPVCVDSVCAVDTDANPRARDDDPKGDEGEGEGEGGEGEGAEGEGEGDGRCGVRVPTGVLIGHVVGGSDDAFAGCHADLDGAFANFLPGDSAIYVAPGSYTAASSVPAGATVLGSVVDRGAATVVAGLIVEESATLRGLRFSDLAISRADDVVIDRCTFDDGALDVDAFAGVLTISASNVDGAGHLDVLRGSFAFTDTTFTGTFRLTGFSSTRSFVDRGHFVVGNDPGFVIDANLDVNIDDSDFTAVGGAGGGLLHTGATLKVRNSTFTGFHGGLLDGRAVGAVRIVEGEASGKSRVDLGEGPSSPGGNVFSDNSADLSIETRYVPLGVSAVDNTWSVAPICDGAIVRLADPDDVWVSITNNSVCILPL